jgi:hypothetical protein
VIHCYTLTGEEIWTFKDEKVLREPQGIALDKNRNVYVAGKDTHNIVVLSPDGKNCKQILTTSDGLNTPYSLHQFVHVMVSSRNAIFGEFSPGILTRSINLPFGSKYTM